MKCAPAQVCRSELGTYLLVWYQKNAVVLNKNRGTRCG